MDENKDKISKEKQDLNSLIDKLQDVNINEPEPVNVEKILEKLKDNKFTNVITLAGSGISTAAGIPDFRSPGGIYEIVRKYELPSAEAIFQLHYFLDNPKPFYKLMKDIFPDSVKPTKAHYFIKLLQDKNILLRHYTQNIDSLERDAGVTDDKLVEAHGSFNTSHCVCCSREHNKTWLTDMVREGRIPKCIDCDELVKPDVILFGEQLPRRFFDLSPQDFRKCDLLIIMGSSLTVYPVASLPMLVRARCPRLIINKTPVGEPQGIQYDGSRKDVFLQGDCDDVIYKLVTDLGWQEEFNLLMETADT